MEARGGAAPPSDTRGQRGAIFSQEPAVAKDAEGGQTARGRAEDSLLRVIERLSDIVGRRRPRNCSLSRRKRPRPSCCVTAVREGPGALLKKPKKNVAGSSGGDRAHHCLSGEGPGDVGIGFGGRLSGEDPGNVGIGPGGRLSGEGPGDVGIGPDSHLSGEGPDDLGIERELCGGGTASIEGEEPPKQTWYSRERCGSYRCLLCDYACDRPRALKTHAWKHAGLLRCSYPVFQDTPGPPPGPEATPLFYQVEVGPREPEPESELESEGSQATEEPAVELQVTVETDLGEERDTPCSRATPEATPLSRSEEAVAVSTGVGQTGSKGSRTAEELAVELQVTVETHLGEEPPGEPFLMRCDTDMNPPARSLEKEEADESAPPSRRRTQSESLRLHSLAAEALVAMPTAAAEPVLSGYGDAGIPAAAFAGPPAAQTPHAREGVAKAGISLPLLAVIEKLLERTDESASDEDVLRELLDGDARTPPGDGAALPEADEDPCDAALRDQHGQRQLRDHEKNQHGVGTVTTMAPVTETMVTVEDSLEERAVEETSMGRRVFRCDACDFASPTAIGVRNHQRIHSSERLYRCCSCNFATTSMNSLWSHMRRHPQGHQAVQRLEQYRCSLCGYACSHPPSLKSHMWKHAADQDYDYERVNRAIDRAISRSGRVQAVPQIVDPWFGPWERPCPEKAAPRSEEEEEEEEGAGTPHALLLFCCCVCGFESPGMERLMEHMKRHEGEIISIVLSRGPAPPVGY